MSVEFATPDSLPYVVAEYLCPGCGHYVMRHGGHAGEAPTGWIRVTGTETPDWACPGCGEHALRAESAGVPSAPLSSPR